MSMHTTHLKEGEPTSEINTTPLIDVMLVLLIMLIVTLPPQRHAVKLDTPRESVLVGDPPKPIRITVDFDGSLAWNGEPVSVETLDQRLAVEARRAIQAEIHVQPVRRARYEDVVHVMAAAERQGLTKFGVVGGT